VYETPVHSDVDEAGHQNGETVKGSDDCEASTSSKGKSTEDATATNEGAVAKDQE
jgi:hypothetical protein